MSDARSLAPRGLKLRADGSDGNHLSLAHDSSVERPKHPLLASMQPDGRARYLRDPRVATLPKQGDAVRRLHPAAATP